MGLIYYKGEPYGKIKDNNKQSVAGKIDDIIVSDGNNWVTNSVFKAKEIKDINLFDFMEFSNEQDKQKIDFKVYSENQLTTNTALIEDLTNNTSEEITLTGRTAKNLGYFSYTFNINNIYRITIENILKDNVFIQIEKSNQYITIGQGNDTLVSIETNNISTGERFIGTDYSYLTLGTNSNIGSLSSSASLTIGEKSKAIFTGESNAVIDGTTKVYLHNNTVFFMGNSGNSTEYWDGTVNNFGHTGPINGEYGPSILIQDKGCLAIDNGASIVAHGKAGMVLEGEARFKVGGRLSDKDLTPTVFFENGDFRFGGGFYNSNKQILNQPKCYFNTGELYFGGENEDDTDNLLYNYPKIYINGGEFRFGTNSPSSNSGSDHQPQAHFDAGYLAMQRRDDKTGDPFLVLNGGSTFIMNGNKDSNSQSDYDPLIIANPNSFIYIGQGSNGTRYGTYGVEGTDLISLSDYTYGLSAGPERHKENVGLRSPKISISDDTLIVIDAAYGRGTNYIKIGADNNKHQQIIITGGSFIQHSSNSHFEIHDDAYIAMDCDSNKEGVFKFGSDDNLKDNSSLYQTPFTMRNIGHSLRYILDMEEPYGKIQGKISTYFTIGIEEEEKSFSISSITSNFNTSLWTANTLSQLMSSDTSYNSSNLLFFDEETRINEENGQKYLDYQYNNTNSHICTLDYNEENLTVTFGPLLDNSLKRYRRLYLNCSTTKTDANFTVTFDNNSDNYTAIAFLPKYLSSIPVKKSNLFSTLHTLEINISDDIVESYEDNWTSTGSSRKHFIGMDGHLGFTSNPITTDGYDIVFGGNSRLGMIEDLQNPGYLAFGASLGIKMWSPANKINIKSKNQKINLSNDNIDIETDISRIKLITQSNLELNNNSNINIKNYSNIDLSNSSSINLNNGSKISLTDGASVTLANQGKISIIEGSSITTSGMGTINIIDRGKIDLKGYSQIQGSSVINESNMATTTFTFSGGDNESSVSFTIEELKALKNLLNNS